MFALKRLAVAAAAGAATLAACGDSTSPDTVDPQSMAASVANLATAFDNNAAFQSMRNLAPSFPSYSVMGLLRGSVVALEHAAQGGRPFTADERRLLASLNSPRGIQALFPSNVLGKTLVWNPDSAGYVLSGLSGAPLNGVRVVLYVANPTTGQPFLPLQPIGYLDLTDESTASYDQLGVLLTLGGLTLADYSVRSTAGTTLLSLNVTGFVRASDGTQQVDFNLTVSVAAGSLTLQADVNSSEGTAVSLTLAGTTGGPTVTSTLDISVSRSRNTIDIHVVDDGGASISGEIRFNGTLVATLTGTAEDIDLGIVGGTLLGGASSSPALAPVVGRSLSQQDAAALATIFTRLVEFLEDFTEGVFAPAWIVF